MVGITATQAAAKLGVSRTAVHKLLGSGQLLRTGIAGRTFLIDSDSVDNLARTGTRHGRAWKESTAWAALSLLSGGSVTWLGYSEKSRLKTRLRDLTVDDVVLLARNRATVRRFRAPGDVVVALRDHLVLTGAAAMRDEATADRFGLTRGAGEADGYAAAGDADTLQAAYGLLDDREGNVTIREVTVEDAFTGGNVPVAAIALDLMESAATRERNAGRRVLKELLHC